MHKYAAEKGLDPLEVGDMVVEAIRNEQFWILTHDEYDAVIRTRVEDILARRNPTPITTPLGYPRHHRRRGASNPCLTTSSGAARSPKTRPAPPVPSTSNTSPAPSTTKPKQTLATSLTKADLEGQEVAKSILRAAFPDDPLIGEEDGIPPPT